jgi:hypothetical protein
VRIKINWKEQAKVTQVLVDRTQHFPLFTPYSLFHFFSFFFSLDYDPISTLLLGIPVEGLIMSRYNYIAIFRYTLLMYIYVYVNKTRKLIDSHALKVY